jgi:hypothetical protein
MGKYFSTIFCNGLPFFGKSLANCNHSCWHVADYSTIPDFGGMLFLKSGIEEMFSEVRSPFITTPLRTLRRVFVPCALLLSLPTGSDF